MCYFKRNYHQVVILLAVFLVSAIFFMTEKNIPSVFAAGPCPSNGTSDPNFSYLGGDCTLDPGVNYNYTGTGTLPAGRTLILPYNSTIHFTGDFNVYGTFKINTNQQLNLADGTVTVGDGTNVAYIQTGTVNTDAQTYTINIKAGSIVVAANGNIGVAGSGYTGDGSWNSGRGCTVGNGYLVGVFGGGCSSGNSTYKIGGGGGHAGSGGSGYYSSTIKPIGGQGYDSALSPAYMGSAGGAVVGCSTSIVNGPGGGYIRIEASSVTVNGKINADGSNISDYSCRGGGGAGGSIYIIADAVSGNGTMTANGASDWKAISSDQYGGGCGSGGYITVATDNNNFTGTRSAASAPGTCHASRLGDDGYITDVGLTAVAISSPAGGENWSGWSTHSIAWTGSGTGIDHYTILLSTDNGSTFPTTIVSSVAGSPYSWTVNNVSAAQAVIKIIAYDSSNNQLASKTSNAFIITPATVTVTAPNTAVSWTAGESHDITWTSGGTIDHFRVSYSTDSGSNWTVLSTSATTPYSWSIPTVGTTHARIMVEALNASNTVLASDASDADFTIINNSCPESGTSLDLSSCALFAGTSYSYTGTITLPYGATITLPATTTIHTTGDFNIYGTLYVNTNQQLNMADGTLTIGDGTNAALIDIGTVNTTSQSYTINLKAGNIVLASGSTIGKAGNGYTAASAGPGGGTSGDLNNSYFVGGGGGHAYAGANGISGYSYIADGGAANDIPSAPANMGSAGGSGSYIGFNNGYGGGYVHLTATGSVMLNGIINVNATNGTTINGNGGGGAGGAIYVTCDSISGNGTLTATGGAGGYCANVTPFAGGGSGSGGIITVFANSDNTFSGNTNVTSASGCSEEHIAPSGIVIINNPSPVLSSISPTSVNGSFGIDIAPSFPLIVNGSDFAYNSVVRWGSADLVTTYVSETQLTAAVPSSLLSSYGSVSITIFSPAPGGGISDDQIFTVIDPNPVSTHFTPQHGSTDFTSLSSLENVPNVKLANPAGSIQWTNPVTVESQDLDSNIKVGTGYVSINKASLDSSLDAPAHLSFSVTTCSSYKAYYASGYRSSLAEIKSAGQECNATTTPACANMTCENNTLSFDVPHFDGYAGEGIITPDSKSIPTTLGVPNDPPVITVPPSDGGSSSATPTDEGDDVTFTAIATDGNTDGYFLAVCATDSITPNEYAPPSCASEQEICISTETDSGSLASCPFNTLDFSEESKDWYAFVCDYNTGSLCSLSSQGTGDSGSPFKVNHAGTFGTVSVTDTLGGTIEPGDTMKFTLSSSDISDPDTDGTQDLLTMHICTDDTADFDYVNDTCTGGTEICSSSPVDPTDTDASCTGGASLVSVPTAHGIYGFKVYVEDTHSFPAIGSDSQQYTVTDVPPVLVSYTASDTPAPAAGGSDPVDFSAVIHDDNGDNDVLSAGGVFYDDAAIDLSSGTCTSSENDCYLAPSCTLSDVSAAGTGKTLYGTDNSLTVSCQVTVWFNADASSSWKAHINMADSINTVTSSVDSDPLTNEALLGIDVVQGSIAYGTVSIGGTSSSQESSMGNVGNQILDVYINGTDMESSSYSIPHAQQKWSHTSSDFDWDAVPDPSGPFSLTDVASGTTDSTGCLNRDIQVRPVHDSLSTNESVFWKLRIPENQHAGSYSGQNTFSTTAGDTCTGTLF